MRGASVEWSGGVLSGARVGVLPKEQDKSISGVNPVPHRVTTKPPWAGPEGGYAPVSTGGGTTFNGKTKPDDAVANPSPDPDTFTDTDPGADPDAVPIPSPVSCPWHERTSTFVPPVAVMGQVAVYSLTTTTGDIDRVLLSLLLSLLLLSLRKTHWRQPALKNPVQKQRQR